MLVFYLIFRLSKENLLCKIPGLVFDCNKYSFYYFGMAFSVIP
jgi:hypothetical protein